MLWHFLPAAKHATADSLLLSIRFSFSLQFKFVFVFVVVVINVLLCLLDAVVVVVIHLALHWVHLSIGRGVELYRLLSYSLKA